MGYFEGEGGKALLYLIFLFLYLEFYPLSSELSFVCSSFLIVDPRFRSREENKKI